MLFDVGAGFESGQVERAQRLFGGRKSGGSVGRRHGILARLSGIVAPVQIGIQPPEQSADGAQRQRRTWCPVTQWAAITVICAVLLAASPILITTGYVPLASGGICKFICARPG